MGVLKKLVLMYESITAEKIKAADWGEGELFGEAKAFALTGFGLKENCVVCATVDRDCAQCVYICQTSHKCNQGSNAKTYEAIERAENAEELKTAFKNRAKHIRRILR